MGILNVTPDSFSDGGESFDLNIALLQAQSLIEQGAQVIDLGAQSTRPGAEEVGPTVEQERLLPVLETIRLKYPEILISVDTFHSEVAQAALEKGANWINDISGGRRDSELLRVVASSGCFYILTHSRGYSQNMNRLAKYCNTSLEVKQELLQATERAIRLGVSPEKIIWDPGLGFAKSTSQVICVLRCLPLLKSEGFPILIGPSRKRFIGEITEEYESKARMWGTAGVVSCAISLGADIVRVHDVEPMIKIIRLSDILCRSLA
ncbi:dihydropteroate synthase (chromatophore) [Paulinella micropora]|uniref:dihydropteroate synthase n=1 Tax=Paulinella micropora TaxID=1928728 RepID=A0A1S6YJ33_9EUKA|nr:dihydropteroate synthase [Paulinella micropora]BBL86542.1 dihydropteroate synthase [Paulinella micropora]